MARRSRRSCAGDSRAGELCAATAGSLASMGAHDREYWRAMPSKSSAFGGGIRLSATTWLIVACVAIFVLDGFLPRQWVVVGSRWEVGVPDAVQQQVLQGTVPTMVQRIDADPAKTLATTQGVLLVRQDNQSAAMPLVAVNQLQSTPFLQRWLYFSTSTALYSTIPGIGVSGLQIWRFIGFQFCHASLNHILFNMIGLFFFGPIVERYLGAKRFTAFYLLCGVAGALLYLLLNFSGFIVATATNGRVMIPGLLFNDPDMPLVGASAGLFGVLIAAARLMPDAKVLLFFVIPMKLKTLAYGLVLVATASVLFRWNNAGGEAAHLGGALAGWYLIHRPDRLRSFFDFLGRADPTSSYHSARRVQRPGNGERSAPSTAEVDRILDKVRSSGLASLNESERRTLRDATRHGNG